MQKKEDEKMRKWEDEPGNGETGKGI